MNDRILARLRGTTVSRRLVNEADDMFLEYENKFPANSNRANNKLDARLKKFVKTLPHAWGAMSASLRVDLLGYIVARHPKVRNIFSAFMPLSPHIILNRRPFPAFYHSSPKTTSPRRLCR